MYSSTAAGKSSAMARVAVVGIVAPASATRVARLLGGLAAGAAAHLGVAAGLRLDRLRRRPAARDVDPDAVGCLGAGLGHADGEDAVLDLGLRLLQAAVARERHLALVVE